MIPGSRLRLWPPPYTFGPQSGNSCCVPDWCPVPDELGLLHDVGRGKRHRIGVWRYTYDDNGNLTAQNDAKNATITLTYDELNRLTAKTYPSGSSTTDVTFAYDATTASNKGLGRRTGMTGDATATWVYDSRGRVATETITINGDAQTFGYTYDGADRLTVVTYPGGEVVTQTYNDRGLPSTLTVDAWAIGPAGYNRLGQLTSLSLPGQKIEITNDYWGLEHNPSSDTNFGRLYQTKALRLGSTRQDLTHQWDAAGNLTSRTDSLGSVETEDFTYDFLDRLTGASNAYSRSYAYDEIGNITDFDGSSYTYGSQPHAVTTAGSTTYAYDANGNMTSRGFQDLTWDDENRLTRVGLTNGLIGRWGLDEGSGSTASDTSDNSNDGTLTNGPTWTTGQHANALDFDGTDDYVNIGDPAGLDSGTSDFTLSAWVYVDDFTGIIFSKGRATGGTQGWELGMEATGKFRFSFLDSDSDGTEGDKCAAMDSGFATGTWYHVGGVRSGGNGTLYVDGVQEATCSNSESAGSIDNNKQARIAFIDGGSSSQAFDGIVDEVRIYHSALTASEVQALYEDGALYATYTYDPYGRRVTAIEGGETIAYYNKYLEKNLTTGVVTRYFYFGGMLLARRNTSTQIYHKDHLTGINTMTDAAGGLVGSIYYYPYGDTRSTSGSIDTEKKFTGQRQSSATGLYYYNARWYDPDIGRFVSADPRIQNMSDSEALNRYTYARNNPLLFVDPTGLDFVFVHGGLDDDFFRFSDIQQNLPAGEPVFFYNYATNQLVPANAKDLVTQSAASKAAADTSKIPFEAADLQNAIITGGLENVTLVGHSLGGAVVAQVLVNIGTGRRSSPDIREAILIDPAISENFERKARAGGVTANMLSSQSGAAALLGLDRFTYVGGVSDINEHIGAIQNVPFPVTHFTADDFPFLGPVSAGIPGVHSQQLAVSHTNAVSHPTVIGAVSQPLSSQVNRIAAEEELLGLI